LEDSKPLGSPRRPKGISSKKPLFQGSVMQRPKASQGAGVGSQQGPSKVPWRTLGAGVWRAPARGTPAPQGLPSLLQMGSPILASAKPSPVPPPPPIGSAVGECHAGSDLREGRGANRMCLGPGE
jgi:hypothetical protein